MFWQLSAHRDERKRISPSVMADWLRLRARTLEDLEVKALEAMDRQFLETLSQEIEHNEARRKASANK